MIKFIERKSELSNLLGDALSGINIMFGEENGTFAISNGAMVSASYYKDGKPAGSLGIIGPIRLDYRKVIPYIEYLSQKVTRMLSGEGESVPEIESEDDSDNDK